MRTQVILAVVLGALLLLPTASAHAELKSSVPAAGARLTAAPASVSVTLTEPVDQSGASLAVFDTNSKQVDLRDLKVTTGNQPVLTVSLQPGLPTGAYVMLWKALSGADGHQSAGTVGFAIGNATAPQSTATNLNRADASTVASRFLVYSGLAVALAALAFLVAIPQYPRPRLTRAMAVGSALHILGVLGLLYSTWKLGDLPLRAVLSTESGQVLASRSILGAGAVVIAALQVFRPTRSGPWAVGTLLTLAAVATSRLGHASLDGPSGIAIDAMHLAAASIWVGGLVLLASLLRANPALPIDQVRLVGRRFGSLALASVIALAVTGFVLVASITGDGFLRHPAAYSSSTWGLALIGKVLAALAMVALAGINRYVFLAEPQTAGLAGTLQKVSRRASRGRIAPLLDGRPNQFRRVVALETTLALIVVGLAGLLTAVSPPREVSAATPQASYGSMESAGDTYSIHLAIDPPPKVGSSSTITFHITETASGAPLENDTCGRASCVSAAISYEGLDGEERHEAMSMETYWMLEDILWSRAGKVHLVFTIASADVFKDEVAFDIVVPEAAT